MKNKKKLRRLWNIWGRKVIKRRQNILFLCLLFVVFFSEIFIIPINGYVSGMRRNWHFNFERYNRVTFAPTIIDLDFDSEKEVIVFTNYFLYCFNSIGEIKWIYETLIDSSFTKPIIADVSGDNKLEIIFALENKIVCLNSLGNAIWSIYDNTTNGVYPTVADLTSDGEKEIIYTLDNKYLYCLRASDGEFLWNITIDDRIDFLNLIVDLDEDGNKEILIGGGYGNPFLYCFNYNGTIKWKTNINNQFDDLPFVADLNQDSVLEIYSSSDDKNLYCLDQNGTIQWKYSTTNSPFITHVLNSTKDEYLELLVLSEFNYNNFKLDCIDHDANFITSYNFNQSYQSSFTVHDMDNDKIDEIFVSTIENGIICIDKNGTQLPEYSIKIDNVYIPPTFSDLNNDNIDEIICLRSIQIKVYKHFNRGLFYGVYLLPVYLIGGALLAYGGWKLPDVIKIIYAGYRSEKSKIKYTHNGETVYLDIEREKLRNKRDQKL